MSAELLGLAFKAPMGSHVRKLILLKLVDAAEDDGTRIFPAIATIAKAAEAHERTVQRTIRLFERIGLLLRLRDGGGRPGDTAEYNLDLALLRRIRDEGFDAVAGKGATNDDDAASEGAEASPDAAMGGATPPMEGAENAPMGGASATHMGGLGYAMGGASATQPLHRPLQDERERTREGGQAEPQPASGAATGQATGDGLPHAELLDRLMAVAVRVSHDSRPAIHAAWRSLSPAERREAVERYPDWLADAGGVRKAVAGLPAYLGERRWTTLKPPAAKAPGRFLANAWSEDWWIIHARRLKDNRPTSLMEGQARSAQPWAVDPAPTAEERAGFVRVAVDGPDWQVWAAAHLARYRLPLPRPDVARFAWAPRAMLSGTGPPGEGLVGEDVAAAMGM